MNVTDLKLGQMVYHKDIYNGNQQMKIVGLREKQVELEGDYSGGTHGVTQKDWQTIEGVLLTQSAEAEFVDCRSCGGSGTDFNPADFSSKSCRRCNGTGKVKL